MGLNDTLKELNEQKEQAERIEREKPEKIAKIKENTSNVFDRIYEFLADYIESGAIKISRTKCNYNYHMLNENIKSEQLLITAGTQEVVVKPVGGNGLGDQMIEMGQRGRSDYNIYTRLDSDTIMIAAKNDNRQGRPERVEFNKQNFEDALNESIKMKHGF